VAARRVLITGGSSGIGAACVRAFDALGDEVHFTYQSGKSRADQLVAELGGRPSSWPLDQGNPTSVAALLASICPGGQALDVLVNNAGLGSATVEKFVEGRAEQDLALLQVNAAGVLWVTEAFMPAMKNGGKIVNISSVGGGITQFPGFRLADGMSKAAVAFLTRQLAAQESNSNIDVFAVCPGATDTAMFQASTLEGMNDESRKVFESRLPKGRLIEPREIADTIVWLASPASKVLHGAVIDASMGLGVRPGLVDGGHE
jgi:NAD(P)-dependent dehydrogenase (short-subunit alcohol dehydrogenase family)